MKQLTRVFQVILCMFMLAAGLAMALPPAPAFAARQKIVVDDDGVQCRNRTTDTIASALVMASDNTTITVCAGTYVTEQLVITGKTNLRLIAKKGVTLVPNADPFGWEMIAVGNSTNVTIQGFTIDGQGHILNSGNHTAIYYYKSSGKIIRNTIVNWHPAIYPTGGADSAGIWITGSGGGLVTVSKNKIVDMDLYGIMLTGQGNVRVTGNTISTRLPPGPVFSTGIYALNGMTGSVTGNKISSDKLSLSSNAFRGIQLDGVSGMKIKGNTVTGAGKGIQIQASALSTNNNVISGNRLNDVETGIWLQAYASTESISADSNKITGNKIGDKAFRGYYGILVSAEGVGLLPPAYYGNLQNEIVKGNTIVNFNEGVTISQGDYSTITGVFEPNKVK